MWGIFLRLVVTYHCTWLVNSAAHAVGYRNFATDDRSRNNWFVSLMTFGEGWHNNHHAFPYSAKHGLRWFELDLTYGIICVLRWARLADAVLVPPGKTAQQHLEDLTWAGARQHFPGEIDATLRATLRKELDLIAELNYAHYFLTVHDIVPLRA